VADNDQVDLVAPVPASSAAIAADHDLAGQARHHRLQRCA
jgi:hypothetical protein